MAVAVSGDEEVGRPSAHHRRRPLLYARDATQAPPQGGQQRYLASCGRLPSTQGGCSSNLPPPPPPSPPAPATAPRRVPARKSAATVSAGAQRAETAIPSFPPPPPFASPPTPPPWTLPPPRPGWTTDEPAANHRRHACPHPRARSATARVGGAAAVSRGQPKGGEGGGDGHANGAPHRPPPLGAPTAGGGGARRRLQDRHACRGRAQCASSSVRRFPFRECPSMRRAWRTRMPPPPPPPLHPHLPKAPPAPHPRRLSAHPKRRGDTVCRSPPWHGDGAAVGHATRPAAATAAAGSVP